MRRQAEPLRFLQAPESGRQGCVGAHSQSLMLHRGDFTLIAIRTVAAQGGAVRGHPDDGGFLVSAQAASSAERRVAAGVLTTPAPAPFRPGVQRP